MAAATKLFLVLVAFVCCMQLVEMARLRRDAPVSNTIDEVGEFIKKTSKNFTEMVEGSTLVKEIKEKFDNISTDDIKNAFEKLSKEAQENLQKLTAQIESLNKKE